MKPSTILARRLVVAAALISVGWGCKDRVEGPAGATDYEPAVIKADGTTPGHQTGRSTATALAPSTSGDDCEPYRDLAEMDHRTPVPLQPMMAWHQKQNMMEHLVAIQRITGGLARDDWAEVAEASALIESSPQMQQMCRHMGAGADGFTELALEFHRRADKIGEAAEARDQTAALAATSETLQACTSCHASYRQELVDARTWQERTGSSHQPESAPHH